MTRTRKKTMTKIWPKYDLKNLWLWHDKMRWTYFLAANLKSKQNCSWIVLIDIVLPFHCFSWIFSNFILVEQTVMIHINFLYSLCYLRWIFVTSKLVDKLHQVIELCEINICMIRNSYLKGISWGCFQAVGYFYWLTG